MPTIISMTACAPSGSQWRTMHMVLGTPIQTLLDDVRRFLDMFPSEVVVIQASHYDTSANGTAHCTSLDHESVQPVLELISPCALVLLCCDHDRCGPVCTCSAITATQNVMQLATLINSTLGPYLLPRAAGVVTIGQMMTTGYTCLVTMEDVSS